MPGRKLIFTNGSRNHAILTARQLGLDGLFEEAFDIVAAGLTPKPAEGAYDAFFERCGVDPRAAAMFEDVAKNFAVPKAKGMTTTLVTTKAGRLDHREAHDQAISEAAGRGGFRDRRSLGISRAAQRPAKKLTDSEESFADQKHLRTVQCRD